MKQFKERRKNALEKKLHVRPGIAKLECARMPSRYTKRVEAIHKQPQAYSKPRSAMSTIFVTNKQLQKAPK